MSESRKGPPVSQGRRARKSARAQALGVRCLAPAELRLRLRPEGAAYEAQCYAASFYVFVFSTSWPENEMFVEILY